MTKPHFPDDVTFYSILKQKASIPDPGLVWSAFAEYDQGCRKQIHVLQNQVKVLLEENSTLNEYLADAKNENECLTRSLASAKTEILHLRSSQHPESPNGESYEDWENRRYPDE